MHAFPWWEKYSCANTRVIVTLLSSLSVLISFKTISSEIKLKAHDSYAMKNETNLRLLVKKLVFLYINQTFVVGTQNDCLNEMVLLSTQHKCYIVVDTQMNCLNQTVLLSTQNKCYKLMDMKIFTILCSKTLSICTYANYICTEGRKYEVKVSSKGSLETAHLCRFM